MFISNYKDYLPQYRLTFEEGISKMTYKWRSMYFNEL